MAEVNNDKIPSLYYKKLMLTKDDLRILGESSCLSEITDESLKAVLSLPLDEFVHAYFMYLLVKHQLKQEQIDDQIANILLSDQLWYKIFFLNNTQIQRLMSLVDNYFSNIKLGRSNLIEPKLKNAIYSNDFRVLLLEGKDFSHKNILAYCEPNEYLINSRNYAYIMQFMDSDKAKKYKLTFFPFFNNGKYSGFDLSEKLDALGEVTSIVMRLILGLDFSKPLSIPEVHSAIFLSKITILNQDYISELLQRICRFSLSALCDYTGCKSDNLLTTYSEKVLRSIERYIIETPQKINSIIEKYTTQLRDTAEDDTEKRKKINDGFAYYTSLSDTIIDRSEDVTTLRTQYKSGEITGPKRFDELNKIAAEMMRTILRFNSISIDELECIRVL